MMKVPVLLSAVGLAFAAIAGEAQPSYYCTFDSANAVTAPAVGTAGSIIGGSFASGKLGNALSVADHSAPVTVNFPVGVLTGACGTVEFWMKIEKSSDSFELCDPSVFRIEASPDVVPLSFQFTSNNGGGLCGADATCVFDKFTSGQIGVQTCSYSSILGQDFGAWHHYAFVWNEKGISSLEGNPYSAFLIDGQVKGSSRNIGWAQNKPALDTDTQVLTIGDVNGASAFLFDELKIWKTDKTTFDLNPVAPVEVPVVSAVTAKQHYPWCGKIDIGYTVAGSTDGLQVKITVKDNTNDKTYEAKTFDKTPTAAVGTHTVVWDATADGVTTASQNMVATVSLIVPVPAE